MVENRVSRVPSKVTIRRVLLSVFDKSQLDILVNGLVRVQPDIEIYSTGGTYRACEKILGSARSHHLKRVSDYTGQPEMHGGLVKTLDFKIYLGLLSEPFNNLHDEDLSRAGALPIDMVVANLYPFSSVIRSEEADCENARSNIDIGGPCMIRAAAKNYIRVASVCDPGDYQYLLEEMTNNSGAVTLETRFSLAKKAFSHTAAYDEAIRSYIETLEPADLQSTYTIS